MPDPRRHTTWRGHTHPPPHAALAGSTPASSQAAPPWRARPPTRVRPRQQGHSSQGHLFLVSSGTSSPGQSWGHPGVCLPGPRSGGAAGCCGTHLSSAASAHGAQTGRLGTPPFPFPLSAVPSPPVVTWSLCGLRPTARGPLTNQVYIGPPLLRWEEPPLPGDEGSPPAAGRPRPCNAFLGGAWAGGSAELGRRHRRPGVSRLGARLYRPAAV